MRAFDIRFGTGLRGEPLAEVARFRAERSFPTRENWISRENMPFYTEITTDSNNSLVSTVASIAFVSIATYC